jgi:hypothetical protein
MRLFHMMPTRPLAALLLVAAAMSAAAAVAPVAEATGESAGALRVAYGDLRARLEKNDFGRPVFLDSREKDNDLRGEVYAVVDHPFATVDSALGAASSWCDILILPYNTKHCTSEADKSLALYVGKKKETPVADAYKVDFEYRLVARSRDYMQVVLGAASGPLGTHNYRIALEATPLDAGHTFVHLSYSYAYSMMSSFAMQAYLATSGAAKVGFTVESVDGDGKPRFVKGMRGVLERNTMRYFLAIDAYLDSLAAPESTRVDKRLNDWFTASERYAPQLHEMERADYLAMKQRETRRLMAARTTGS